MNTSLQRNGSGNLKEIRVIRWCGGWFKNRTAESSFSFRIMFHFQYWWIWWNKSAKIWFTVDRWRRNRWHQSKHLCLNKPQKTNEILHVFSYMYSTCMTSVIILNNSRAHPNYNIFDAFSFMYNNLAFTLNVSRSCLVAGKLSVFKQIHKWNCFQKHTDPRTDHWKRIFYIKTSLRRIISSETTHKEHVVDIPYMRQNSVKLLCYCCS